MTIKISRKYRDIVVIKKSRQTLKCSINEKSDSLKRGERHLDPWFNTFSPKFSIIHQAIITRQVAMLLASQISKMKRILFSFCAWACFNLTFILFTLSLTFIPPFTTIIIHLHYHITPHFTINHFQYSTSSSTNFQTHHQHTKNLLETMNLHPSFSWTTCSTSLSFLQQPSS